MTSQHEQTVTPDTSAGALTGTGNKNTFKKKKNTSILELNLLDSNNTLTHHLKETAGMAVYYHRESNNVGVRFLSHS